MLAFASVFGVFGKTTSRIHTVGVTGSNPVASTIRKSFITNYKKQATGIASRRRQNLSPSHRQKKYAQMRK
jgi:hypothetical protein